MSTSNLEKLKQSLKEKAFLSLKSGDQINLYLRVKEGEKERTQLFKGTVIKVRGRNLSRSFTVRKVSYGVGVEKTFFFANPNIEKIEQLSSNKVRRARLFYLRQLRGRSARLKRKPSVSSSASKSSSLESDGKSKFPPPKSDLKGASTPEKSTHPKPDQPNAHANDKERKTKKRRRRLLFVLRFPLNPLLPLDSFFSCLS